MKLSVFVTLVFGFALVLMMRFKSVSLSWHPRIMSVMRLGH